MELNTYLHCPCCGAASISPQLSARDHTVSGEQFAIWQCDQCSVRFTQNIPVQSEIGNYYQSGNYISHSDIKKGFINSIYHIIRKRTLHQKKKLLQRVTSLQKGA